MSPWMWATLGLTPALLVGLWRSGRDALPRRLVALELATSLSIATLLTLSFAFDQASSTDLALALALLVLPGSLVFVLFTERWL